MKNSLKEAKNHSNFKSQSFVNDNEFKLPLLKQESSFKRDASTASHFSSVNKKEMASVELSLSKNGS